MNAPLPIQLATSSSTLTLLGRIPGDNLVSDDDTVSVRIGGNVGGFEVKNLTPALEDSLGALLKNDDGGDVAVCRTDAGSDVIVFRTNEPSAPREITIEGSSIRLLAPGELVAAVGQGIEWRTLNDDAADYRYPCPTSAFPYLRSTEVATLFDALNTIHGDDAPLVKEFSVDHATDVPAATPSASPPLVAEAVAAPSPVQMIESIASSFSPKQPVLTESLAGGGGAPTAVDYVRAGLALVPIPAGLKGPRTKGWNERENAVTTEARARQLRGNLGLAHTYSTPSTCTLDFDNLGEARPWCTERGVNIDSYLDAPGAVRIDSGRPNRAKLLYRLPPGMAPLRSITVADGAMEFRCASADGKTYQDVLPPSIHPDTGKPYRWIGDWRKIPELPAELLTLWQSGADSKSSVEHGARKPDELERTAVLHAATLTTFAEVKSAVEHLAAKDWAEPYGRWIDVLHALRSLGQAGFEEQANALWHEFSATSTTQYDPDEAEEKWRTCEPTSITYKSIFKWAQAAGWGNPASGDTALAPSDDLAFVDFGSLDHTTPAPRDEVVPGWLPRGTVIYLGGAGGHGKTTAAQQLAFCVASGDSFLGLPIVQGRTLGIFGEDDSEELLRRGARILAAQFLSPGQVRPWVHLDGRAGKDNLLMTFNARRVGRPTALFKRIKEECAAFCPILVILDNAAQLFGGEENDRGQVTQFVNMLTGLAREFNCAVLLLGHPAKATGSEYSGSTAWENAVRTRLFLEQCDDGTLALRKSKSNYSPLEEIKIEYRSPPGAFFRVPAGGSETPQAVETAKSALLEALRVLTGREQSASHVTTARNYLPKLMEAEDLLGDIPIAVARRALSALLDSKAVLPNQALPWKTADRHQATGLVLDLGGELA